MAVVYDYFPHALQYVRNICNRCRAGVVIGSESHETDCNITITDQQYSDGAVIAGYEISGVVNIDAGGTATKLYYYLGDGGECIRAEYDITADIPNYTRLTINIAVTYTSTTA